MWLVQVFILMADISVKMMSKLNILFNKKEKLIEQNSNDSFFNQFHLW